ncbi:MAG: hypothetical protein CM1200mP3_18070 [Chloroflexota bacterium]|nr:MAG: hypothetical protein CM1200mP3_18070 [Chloroflexota bacterium]
METVENDHTFEVLERLVEEGKILSYGAAIGDSEQSHEISEILLNDRRGGFYKSLSVVWRRSRFRSVC